MACIREFEGLEFYTNLKGSWSLLRLLSPSLVYLFKPNYSFHLMACWVCMSFPLFTHHWSSGLGSVFLHHKKKKNQDFLRFCFSRALGRLFSIFVYKKSWTKLYVKTFIYVLILYIYIKYTHQHFIYIYIYIQIYISWFTSLIKSSWIYFI